MESLSDVRHRVERCKDCVLYHSRVKAVPGEGPEKASIMFIGEGPGFHENQQGKPFVGQAGKFLDELLANAGVKREEVFITNVVKCRPPGNRDPQPEELEACGKYLDRQIELINPKIIVTLGRFSMAKFFGAVKISQIHGKSKKIENRLIVAMYHPAAALHQPALKSTLLEDFSKLKIYLQNVTERVDESKKPILVEIEEEIEEDKPTQLSLF